MGKVPNIRRILSESFPDLDWMPRLAQPINVFMEQAIRLFDRNLTFSDNFNGQVREFQANGQYPIQLSWDRTDKPVAVWIGRVRTIDGSTPTYTDALSLVWRFNESGQIEISDILGLDDSGTNIYNIVIIGVTG